MSKKISAGAARPTMTSRTIQHRVRSHAQPVCPRSHPHFLVPDLVLRINHADGPREYPYSWQQACTAHPYEARELLDRLATIMDQMTQGDI